MLSSQLGFEAASKYGLVLTLQQKGWGHLECQAWSPTLISPFSVDQKSGFEAKKIAHRWQIPIELSGNGTRLSKDDALPLSAKDRMENQERPWHLSQVLMTCHDGLFQRVGLASHQYRLHMGLVIICTFKFCYKSIEQSIIIITCISHVTVHLKTKLVTRMQQAC